MKQEKDVIEKVHEALNASGYSPVEVELGYRIDDYD
jgi:uncharacterized protein (UPF0297 family)